MLVEVVEVELTAAQAGGRQQCMQVLRPMCLSQPAVMQFASDNKGGDAHLQTGDCLPLEHGLVDLHWQSLPGIVTPVASLWASQSVNPQACIRYESLHWSGHLMRSKSLPS